MWRNDIDCRYISYERKGLSGNNVAYNKAAHVYPSHGTNPNNTVDGDYNSEVHLVNRSVRFIGVDPGSQCWIEAVYILIHPVGKFNRGGEFYSDNLQDIYSVNYQPYW